MKCADILRYLITAAGASTLLADSARAQLNGSVTAVTDYRLRGLSLNGGEPAISASVSYDHESGAYVGASITGGETKRFGPQFLSHNVYAGYARRLESGLTADIGISNTQVYSNVFRRFSGNYPEIYAGLSADNVSAHIYFSPSFIAPDLRTIYVDINATHRPAKRLRLFGHVGVLVPLGGAGETVVPRARHDLRAGIAAELGQSEVQLVWIRSGASDRYLADRRQSRDAVVIGATWFF